MGGRRQGQGGRPAGHRVGHCVPVPGGCRAGPALPRRSPSALPRPAFRALLGPRFTPAPFSPAPSFPRGSPLPPVLRSLFSPAACLPSPPAAPLSRWCSSSPPRSVFLLPVPAPTASGGTRTRPAGLPVPPQPSPPAPRNATRKEKAPNYKYK